MRLYFCHTTGLFLWFEGGDKIVAVYEPHAGLRYIELPDSVCLYKWPHPLELIHTYGK
jgi:hypothetical protein